MAFKFFNKKKAPKELPELISDEISNQGSKNDSQNQTDSSENELKDYLKNKEESEKNYKSNFPVEKKEPSVQQENENKKLIPLPEDKSFFNEFENNLHKEIGDLNKLEEWYNKKFLPRDIVSDMRGYWESQKTNSIISLLGKNLQEKISKKLEKLQKLEKDWQNTYFELVEKEEEIKDEEKELKEILAEFVKICKKKDKSGSRVKR